MSSPTGSSTARALHSFNDEHVRPQVGDVLRAERTSRRRFRWAAAKAAHAKIIGAIRAVSVPNDHRTFCKTGWTPCPAFRAGVRTNVARKHARNCSTPRSTAASRICTASREWRRHRWSRTHGVTWQSCACTLARRRRTATYRRAASCSRWRRVSANIRLIIGAESGEFSLPSNVSSNARVHVKRHRFGPSASTT
jgi:hypothetical protein